MGLLGLCMPTDHCDKQSPQHGSRKVFADSSGVGLPRTFSRRVICCWSIYTCDPGWLGNCEWVGTHQEFWWGSAKLMTFSPGVLPNVAGSTIAWGVQMPLYQLFKTMAYGEASDQCWEFRAFLPMIQRGPQSRVFATSQLFKNSSFLWIGSLPLFNSMFPSCQGSAVPAFPKPFLGYRRPVPKRPKIVRAL